MLHPHAPGTAVHDPAELSILLQVLSSDPDRSAEQPLDLYAAKGAIGHGLGAAGLASLVIAALALTTGKRPPMPWLDEPISLADQPTAGLRPSAEWSAGQSASHSGAHAVFAAGFGGHTAGAVIQRRVRFSTPALTEHEA
jgi:3-oxoacyl-(acyl-carrier-protein) synthase